MQIYAAGSYPYGMIMKFVSCIVLELIISADRSKSPKAQDVVF